MEDEIDVDTYRLLINLLAVIHRDGGHHTYKVGLVKSTQDAVDIAANKNALYNAVLEVAKHHPSINKNDPIGYFWDAVDNLVRLVKE